MKDRIVYPKLGIIDEYESEDENTPHSQKTGGTMNNTSKGPNRATIIRSVTLVLAVINQVIAVLGSTSFAQSGWYQFISIVITAVVSVINAWENNDWTHFARLGTKVLDALEDGKITEEEVVEMLEKSENKQLYK